MAYRLTEPKFISFDCYGTLIDFQANAVASSLMADRIAPHALDGFARDFTAHRFDEVLGAWKPYRAVLADALARTCRRWSVPFREEDAEAVYRAVPGWGPHADVPAALARLAGRFPLVILSNAAEEQIAESVSRLGARFHAVFTAEGAGAYKPRFRAFEFMLDGLGCGPEDLLHVSSSLRYDLISAHGLGIANKAFVARGHEPSTPYYGYAEIGTLGDLPGLLGL